MQYQNCEKKQVDKYAKIGDLNAISINFDGFGIGANLTLFKYRFPKSFIPLLNIPGMLCIINMIMRAIRRKVRFFNMIYF